jgi:hypothetical protein
MVGRGHRLKVVPVVLSAVVGSMEDRGFSPHLVSFGRRPLWSGHCNAIGAWSRRYLIDQVDPSGPSITAMPDATKRSRS